MHIKIKRLSFHNTNNALFFHVCMEKIYRYTYASDKQTFFRNDSFGINSQLYPFNICLHQSYSYISSRCIRPSEFEFKKKKNEDSKKKCIVLNLKREALNTLSIIQWLNLKSFIAWVEMLHVHKETERVACTSVSTHFFSYLYFQLKIEKKKSC